jgi:hypothetical protein
MSRWADDWRVTYGDAMEQETFIITWTPDRSRVVLLDLKSGELFQLSREKALELSRDLKGAARGAKGGAP